MKLPAPTLASPERAGQTARAIRDEWRGMVPDPVKDPRPPECSKPGTRREFIPRGEGPRKRWAMT